MIFINKTVWFLYKIVFRPGLLMVKRFDPLRKIPNRVETGLKIFNSVSYRFITGLTFILTDFNRFLMDFNRLITDFKRVDNRLITD